MCVCGRCNWTTSPQTASVTLTLNHTHLTSIPPTSRHTALSTPPSLPALHFNTPSPHHPVRLEGHLYYFSERPASGCPPLCGLLSLTSRYRPQSLYLSPVIMLNSCFSVSLSFQPFLSLWLLRSFCLRSLYLVFFCSLCCQSLPAVFL